MWEASPIVEFVFRSKARTVRAGDDRGGLPGERSEAQLHYRTSKARGSGIRRRYIANGATLSLSSKTSSAGSLKASTPSYLPTTTSA